MHSKLVFRMYEGYILNSYSGEQVFYFKFIASCSQLSSLSRLFTSRYVDCMRHIIGCVAPCETHVENIHGSFERAGNLLNFLGVTKKCKKASWYTRLRSNVPLTYLLRFRTVIPGFILTPSISSLSPVAPSSKKDNRLPFALLRPPLSYATSIQLTIPIFLMSISTSFFHLG